MYSGGEASGGEARPGSSRRSRDKGPICLLGSWDGGLWGANSFVRAQQCSCPDTAGNTARARYQMMSRVEHQWRELCSRCRECSALSAGRWCALCSPPSAHSRYRRSTSEPATLQDNPHHLDAELNQGRHDREQPNENRSILAIKGWAATLCLSDAAIEFMGMLKVCMERSLLLSSAWHHDVRAPACVRSVRSVRSSAHPPATAERARHLRAIHPSKVCIHAHFRSSCILPTAPHFLMVWRYASTHRLNAPSARTERTEICSDLIDYTLHSVPHLNCLVSRRPCCPDEHDVLGLTIEHEEMGDAAAGQLSSSPPLDRSLLLLRHFTAPPPPPPLPTLHLTQVPVTRLGPHLVLGYFCPLLKTGNYSSSPDPGTMPYARRSHACCQSRAREAAVGTLILILQESWQ